MPILKREPDALSEDLFDLDAPWLVAHVRSRQEKALARYLGWFKVPFYLPQMEKRLRRNGRTIVSFLPLFGGYLFFRGGDAERTRTLRSNLIVNIIDAFDQSTLHEELAQLHRLQLTDGRLVPYPFLSPGDTVAITEGAFKGYRGTVVREKGRERLVVSVTMIRQSVSVEIDRELLVPHLETHYEYARRPVRSSFPGDHRP
jgi:hypothetical protein